MDYIGKYFLSEEQTEILFLLIAYIYIYICEEMSTPIEMQQMFEMLLKPTC